MCLCIADREQYILVNLGAVTATPLLPISQVPPEPGTRPHRPMILAVTEEEFLILSWTGAGTMGVFINLNGDPVRGTLQWPVHPLSISSSFPFSRIFFFRLRVQQVWSIRMSRPCCRTKRFWCTTSSRKRSSRRYHLIRYQYRMRLRSQPYLVRSVEPWP